MNERSHFKACRGFGASGDNKKSIKRIIIIHVGIGR